MTDSQCSTPAVHSLPEADSRTWSIAQQWELALYIHLSAPLAPHYVHFPHAWLAEAYRSGRVIVDFHPAEECPYRSDFFDLVVMIFVGRKREAVPQGPG
jgi:hypothetical protein